MSEARLNPVDHPVADVIRDRWSPVCFEPEDLGDETICSLFEASRWAASSFNEQPWRFLIARRRDEAEFERMLSCIVPGNREWAQHAGLLVIVTAVENFSHNGKPNAHARFDTGAAVAHLLLQAAALGLQGHAMGGFDADRVRELYGLGNSVDAICAVALGRVGDGSRVDAATAERDRGPRQRRALSEIVFSGRFGTPWK